MPAGVTPSLRSPWLLRTGIVGGALLAIAVVGLAAYGAYLATFLELPRSEDHPPLRLHASPFQLKAGLSLKTARLTDRLQRLGYHAVRDAVSSPGEYELVQDRLTIYLNPWPDGLAKSSVVTLKLD
ncbi:hypothetical protein, partial [Petrachloros mirabilis]